MQIQWLPLFYRQMARVSFCLYMCLFNSVTSAATIPLPDTLEAAQDQTIMLLQKLIRIDTSNPPGGETAAAKYLKEFFDAAGIDAEIIESAPGRGNLIARLKGDGTKKPVLLASHLDVVGVEREHWSVDPFGGEIKNGRVFGRGAADMKDLVATQLEVMLLLKRTGAKLHREIIFASVADEESSGTMGMDFLVKNYWPKIAAEFSFDEGTRGRPYLKDGKVRWASLQVTERRMVNLRVVAHGTSAHSMMQMQDNALYTLARALDKISKYTPPVKLNPAIQAYIDGMARLEHKPKDWYKGASNGSTEEARGLYAMLHTTINPTILKGGFRDNVVPAEAEANLNCRLLPGVEAGDLVRNLLRIVDDSKVTIEALDTNSPRTVISSMDSDAVKAYTRVIHANFGDGVPFIPTVGAGASDSRFLRAKGVDAYALEPYDDGVQNKHGNDESVSVDGVRSAVKLYYELLLDLGGQSSR